MGASNIVDGDFFAERWIEHPEVISRKGDILLSVKGTIGKVYIQKETEMNISRQIMAIRSQNDLNKKCVPNGVMVEYLYWFCTGYEKDIRDNCM